MYTQNKRKTGGLQVALAIGLLLGTTLQAQPTAPTTQPAAISTTHSIPVLEGLAHNPVLQVSVLVAAGASIPLQQVHLKLDKATAAALAHIDIFLTEAGPFSPRQKIGTLAQPGTHAVVAAAATLHPGKHLLWISPVLKGGTTPGTRLSIRCHELAADGGMRIPVVPQQPNSTLRTGIAIRRAGDDNVHTYRIPGLVQTNKGTLLAVYDIRYNNSADLPGNIDVGLSRSTDGGKSWEPMKIIMDMGAPHENNGIGDPAILFDPQTNTTWVAALWSKGNRSIAGSKPGLSPDTTGQFVLVKSTDDGRTWSAPINITEQVKKPGWHLFFNGPGSGIAMQDGKLVFAAQYWDEEKIPHSTLIYSTDKGNTWVGNIHGPKANTTEAQVIETTPGTIMLNMRDNRGGYRSIATTTNLGQSWLEHPTSYSALQDPVCMGSIIKARVRVKGQLKDVLFFSNPNTSSGRYNMTIKASLDNGNTWLPANALLIDVRNTYGYSSLTQIDEHTLGVLYEGQGDLYFLTIPVMDIIRE